MYPFALVPQPPWCPMSSAVPPVLIMVVACTIVLIGWFLCAALVALFSQRRVARFRAESPERVLTPEGSALLLYGLSVFFWPAGFALGVYFLGKPETAIQGRNCLWIGLGYISVIVVLTCAAMVGWVLIAPPPF